ncbi:unnamed protein product [Mytilus coruscus]|uniref:Ubiquitin-like domain-containing protein n=1 Tax=Mytilus coruscus TaxID=42192 RepID=A0A6J8DHE0_MYTCO|nr:unnamed protein product [Mytilus coruscus]
MECEEENFYKLIAFLVDVCPKVVCNYFKRKVLCGDTFESYLKRKKHILFHLNCNKKCCECVAEVVQQKHISNNHFKSLFDEDLNKRVHHVKNCICIYVAKKNISPSVVLDVSLANCMLKNCEKLDKEIDHWLTTLINTRNKVVHSTDTKSINDLDFNNYWKKIEGAVLGLAKAIDNEYEQTVVANVEYLRRRQMLSDDKLKECQLLHDWWRDKCCDFEKTLDESRSQLTTVCETTKAINENESRHHSEINEKIDNIGCKIDTLTDMQSRSNKDASNKDSCTHDVQSFTEYDKKDIQVVMNIEANQSFCEADVERKFLSPLKSLLNSIDSKVNIKSYSTFPITTVGQPTSLVEHSFHPRDLLPSSSGSSHSLKPTYIRSSGESSTLSEKMAVEKKTTKPIFVKNEWNDDVKIFWLSNRSKVRELKCLIQIEIGIHPDNQELVFEGTHLTDDRTVLYYGNQTAEFVGSKFIYVRTKKNEFIEIDIKNCMTVFEIKELIFAKEGIPYYKQVLYNGTVILEDGQHIKNCGIKEGQSLEMFYYLRFPAPVTQPQICSKGQSIERNKRKSSDQRTSGMTADAAKKAKDS